jgi:hypothetical protein
MGDDLRLRQICLVAPALDPAVDDFAAIFGLKVCYRDPHVEMFGLENALFVIDHTFIEIVAPTRGGTPAGRFLERSGGSGGYMVIFDCADPDARQAHAAALGIPTAFEIDRPGVYRCVQLHPKACRGAMIEFDRTAGGEDLHGAYGPAGGQGWQWAVDTRIVSGVDGIDMASPRPAELAAHWGAILQRPALAERGGDRIDVACQTIDFRAAPEGEAERLAAVRLRVARGDLIRDEARRRGRLSGPDTVIVAGVEFHLETHAL